MHQLNSHPGLFTACAESILNDVNTTILDIQESIEDSYNTALSSAHEIHRTLVVPDVPLSQVEAEAWESSNYSIYEIIEDIENTIWNDEYWDDLNKSNLEDARKLLNDLYAYRKEACIFREMNLGHRVKALKMLNLLSLTESNFFDIHYNPLVHQFSIVPYSEDDEEHLYNAILSTTPTEDYPYILNFFQGDDNSYSEFFSVANKMYDIFGE